MVLMIKQTFARMFESLLNNLIMMGNLPNIFFTLFMQKTVK